MLVIVISLFAVCWAPVLIDNVLAAFEVVDKFNYGAIKHMRQAFSLMSYANSCVNPIVYAFMSKNFRESFKSAMCACICCVKLCNSGGRGQRGLRRQSFNTQNSTISYYSTSVTMKHIRAEDYETVLTASDTSV